MGTHEKNLQADSLESSFPNLGIRFIYTAGLTIPGSLASVVNAKLLRIWGAAVLSRQTYHTLGLIETALTSLMMEQGHDVHIARQMVFQCLQPKIKELKTQSQTVDLFF